MERSIEKLKVEVEVWPVCEPGKERRLRTDSG